MNESLTIGAMEGKCQPMGAMDGRCHRIAFRIYYSDTDPAGVVYHPNYLSFAERARLEMLRLNGIDHMRLLSEHEIALAVRSAEIDYRRSARLDDVVEIESRLVHLGGSSLHFEQMIRRDGDILAHLLVRIVCMNLNGGSKPLPPAERRIVETLLTEKAS